MIIVSDASPIINLAVIGQLNLLQKLYGKVIIPQAVYEEIVIEGAGQAGATEITQSVVVSRPGCAHLQSAEPSVSRHLQFTKASYKYGELWGETAVLVSETKVRPFIKFGNPSGKRKE